MIWETITCEGEEGEVGLLPFLAGCCEEPLAKGPGCMCMATIVLGALRCLMELDLALRSSHLCTWVTNHDICFKEDLGEQMVKYLLFKSRLTVRGHFRPRSEVKSQGLSLGSLYPEPPHACIYPLHSPQPHALSVKRVISEKLQWCQSGDFLSAVQTRPHVLHNCRVMKAGKL